MKEFYVDKNFRDSALEIIEQADEIITAFAEDGYDLTLRQLYYQFVAKGLIANKQSEYKRLGSIINDARLAGLIDWDSIVDRTREYEELQHWDSPAEILQGAADGYRIDTRFDQREYIEVWVEKDALSGVVAQACQPLDVGFLSCRGFVSQSSMWLAAKRFIEKEHQQNTYIIHLGDHDPSGIDMTRDIQERLELFGSEVTVERIALNEDQIQIYNPPPNPAKTTDSRYASYRRKYGDESWELDALDPHVLTDLITQAILYHTDKKKQRKRINLQETERAEIQKLANNWDL